MHDLSDSKEALQGMSRSFGLARLGVSYCSDILWMNEIKGED